MSSPLGEILNSINNKGGLLEREFIEAEYKPFVVNRSLSYFPDTVLFANEAVQFTEEMSAWDQYLFYYYAVPKGRRFARWHKPSSDKYLKAVMEFFNYSERKAHAALKILSEAQCKEIAQCLDKGGKKK